MHSRKRHLRLRDSVAPATLLVAAGLFLSSLYTREPLALAASRTSAPASATRTLDTDPSAARKPSEKRQKKKASAKKHSKKKAANKKRSKKSGRKKASRKQRQASKSKKKRAASKTKRTKKSRDAKGRKAKRRKARAKKIALAAQPPAAVALPEAGRYPAAKILRLAAELRGRPVRVLSSHIDGIEVDVIPAAAGRDVTLSEVRLLLAVYRIYLFDHQDPDEGAVLVATSNPRWQPTLPRYTRVLKVKPEYYERAWSAVQEKLEAYNERRPAGEREATATAAERAHKILVRAGSPEILEELETLVVTESQPDPDRASLYAYAGRFRRVGELRDVVVEELATEERERVRFVVRRRGNQLLYRAPPDLGKKVTGLLERYDARQPAPARQHTGSR